ncbi:PfaD family polyunsaturated fatty acid/polyketide biosynthesis protein [Nocardia sp. GCM10030253]|uniref:PfaD family polyunsaturated fatty acid/polyketide biosynthesis protein n=1 Tax=Nocardia sp. GCM10030253 TaxID=3273404 RepID=UPI00364048BE
MTTQLPAWGLSHDAEGIYQVLADIERPCFVGAGPEGIGVASTPPPAGDSHQLLAAAGPLPPARLGSSAFLKHHGVRFPYMAGAMAGGIASEELVIALATEGYLASFGAAGLLPDRIESALQRFQREIPGLPYACNLIHSPSEEVLERGAVELYLRYGVRCVEASAYMDLTAHLVRYRVAGLARDRQGGVVAQHRVIAKLSRTEVAERFMRPAPATIVNDLVRRGLVTAEQAELARQVPMADDITVEADSGGHTDRRPLSVLLPSILLLRDRIVREQGYATPIRIGAAGGIGTPHAAAAAFAAGAAYVVTGSVNQSCLEAGASPATKKMLATATMADCAMAPAADMFELGVELQVLRKGTLFPMRAKQLYELYRAYDGIDALPTAERHKLETQVFRRPLEEVWQETAAYFEQRDPAQLDRARNNEKRRMALIFRWYLGLSSRWSNVGQADRVTDYQIWCGPAMGGFNDWVHGSYLEAPENRRVVEVAHHLMYGAAFLSRVAQLRYSGVGLPARCLDYRPEPLRTGR